MRTFVAIELDRECRNRLAAVLDSLRSAVGGVLWARPDSMHLTVKFLGEIGEQDVRAAADAMKAAAATVSPFRIRCGAVSGFPLRGDLRVIHVEVEEPTGALTALAEATEGLVAEKLGIAREKRVYKPHVSLGRVKRHHRCPPLAEIIKMGGEPNLGGVQVDEMVLMRSIRTPLGSAYSILSHAPLGA